MTLYMLLPFETATLECKKREINTLGVREALDLLEPYIQPPWLIPQYRNELDAVEDNVVDREGQQPVLRGSFRGISTSIRELLANESRLVRVWHGSRPESERRDRPAESRTNEN